MKFPKPWFRKGRGWFVTIDGRQIKLGPVRETALHRYQELMAKPRQRCVPSESLLTLFDVFLDWCQNHRSLNTYEWYRYRLEHFAVKYPNLHFADLRPFHVQRWIDDM